MHYHFSKQRSIILISKVMERLDSIIIDIYIYYLDCIPFSALGSAILLRNVTSEMSTFPHDSKRLE